MNSSHFLPKTRLGQPIEGLVFDRKWLEFISQSQIKGDFNFRNTYIRDSSQSKHGNVFFSLSQNFFTKIVYVAYVHDFEGLLFSIFTFLFQLEYFSFVKQKVLDLFCPALSLQHVAWTTSNVNFCIELFLLFLFVQHFVTSNSTQFFF